MCVYSTAGLTTVSSFPIFQIVRTRKPVSREYSTFFFASHLVRPAYEVEVVLVQELCRHLRAEGEGDPPVVLAPPHGVLVRVGPEEVAEEALVRDVGGAHDPPDLLHRLQVRAEAAVAAEDLLVDDGRHREAVEAVREGLPQLDVVPALA